MISSIRLRLPDLLEGEIYQGWLERVRVINNYGDLHGMYRDLRAVALTATGGSAEHYHEVGAAVTATDYSEFIEQHTLVPFLELPDKSHYFREGRWVASPWNYHNDSMSRVLSMGKKCVACEQTDIRTRGVGYLRRDHQIPGVAWCLMHGTRLVWLSAEPPTDSASADDSIGFEAIKARVFELMCGLG
ncbi:MAG: TniQ family protein [Burkholderiaceae bacterium]|nr:TniQ family protein [Burkholderiaceae bacterium]